MQTSGPNIFLPFILMFVVFYFLLIRPQTKEKRRREEMLKSVSKNDEVVTLGGLHATVVNVKEKTLILRIDDNTKVELDKSAVSYVKKKKGQDR